MATVRGKSKSTARRMRLNKIDETFEEVVAWSVPPSNINSSSVCETQLREQRPNEAASASCNVKNVRLNQ